ncbi:MAG: EamA family transporter [Alphaproteobacteria bacterium]
MIHFSYFNKERTGIFLILLSSFSFGIKPSVMKWVFEAGVDVYTFLLISSFGAALTSFCLAKARGLSLRIPTGFVGPVILLGALEALVYFGYCQSINYIPVSIAEILFFTFPLILAALSFLLGKRIPTTSLCAILIAFVGLLFALGIFTTEVSLDTFGISLVLSAAFFNAVVILFSKDFLMKKLDATALVFYGGSIMFVVFTAVAFSRGFSFPRTTHTWGLVGTCALLNVIGSLAYFGALFRIGAIRIALISNVEPLIGVLCAILLLGETLLPLQGFGILLVLSAVFIISFKKKKELKK